MKKLTVLLCLIISYISFSQEFLLKINGKEINYDAFIKEQKTSLKYLGTEKTITNFINFELLKQYALKNGAEEDIRFLKKYFTALNILQDSLYFPTSISEPELKKYYEKFKLEKKIQLLIVATKKKADALYVKLKNNKIAFTQAIKKYSLDKSYSVPKYIIPGFLNETLEEVAYKLKKGEISKPISYLNYFAIINISEERKYLGDVYLSEIAIPKDEVLCNKIYNKLLNGEKFETLFKQYSLQDRADGEGNLPKINFNIPTELYNQIVQLKPGEFSKPFIFENECLIIKLNAMDDINTYAKARQRVKEKFLLSPLKTNLDFSYVIPQVEKAGKVFINKKEIENTENAIKNNKNFNDSIVLLKVNDFEFSNKNIKDSLKLFANINNSNNLVYKYIELLKVNKILQYYKDEYFFQQDRIKPLLDSLKKSLLIEYAYDNIYEKAAKDDKGIKKFIKNNKAKYTWDKRAKVQIYYCANEQTAVEIQKLLQKRKNIEEIMKIYKNRVDDKGNILVFIFEGKIQKKSLDFPAAAIFKKGIQLVKHKDKYAVVNIDAIIPSETMILEEIRQEITPPYQEYFFQKTLAEENKKATIEKNNLLIQKLIKTTSNNTIN